MPTADVIVAGLGAVGSAAAAALARRGVSVLGLDAHRPPHDRGSSHGETRIIREAYFEHPLYVPLVRGAYTRWRELERRSGRRLLLETGALILGEATSELVAGAVASAERHGVPHQTLEPREVERRWPAITPPPGAVGVYEPGAGVLFPEACVGALLAEAERDGVELRFDEPLLRFAAGGAAVEVSTPRGLVSAERLLLTAGAWIPALAPELPLTVERQVLHWFAPAARTGAAGAAGAAGGRFAPGSFPVLLVEEPGAPLWYGVPDVGSGVKLALHHSGVATTADALEREVRASDVEAVRAAAHPRLRGLASAPHRSTVCMYTNTPDGHFLIDELPEAPGVLVASACSGHGFKFASVLGELLADRLTGAPLALDLEAFRLDRSALSAADAAG